MTKYDTIIVGLGAMGSAAAWQLARRGLRVLAFDRYTPPHNLGSTHGRTRIIREAYFEHPSYVPFVRRAYELWADTERAASTQLFLRTGGLSLGAPDGEIVAGALASVRVHNVEHEVLSAADVRHRFPVLAPADGMVGVLEKRAGVLFPEQCVVAQLQLAREAGAELRVGERVVEWSESVGGNESLLEVRTDSGDRFTASRVVLAAGLWVTELVQRYTVPLAGERQIMYWFAPLSADGFAADECPVVVWEEPGGVAFATFPDLGDGVKIAIHHAGAPADPDSVNRNPGPEDEAAARRLLARFVPSANGVVREAAVCLYTNTPDQHFIIDYLDSDRRVILVSPCSGHGFKFASAVGEVVAQLASDEPPSLDISLFSLARFRAGAGVAGDSREAQTRAGPGSAQPGGATL